MKPFHFNIKYALPLKRGERIDLDGGEARHIARVLRLKTDSLVNLVNGIGGMTPARIVKIGKASVTFEIEAETIIRDDRLPIELIVGIIKGERMDWLIQKATELGVSAIRPVLTRHTVVGLDDDKRYSRTTRWQEIAMQALKQCKGLTSPSIYPVSTLSEAVLSVQASGTRLFLSESCDEKGIIQAWRQSDEPPATVAIGPEGGFSDEEQTMFKRSGFTPASLGKRTLRSETAAIAAIAVLGSLIYDIKTP
ncbi:MAG: 16S rRNA (uracil(1498)-N(3))-methyltransferase [Desulfobacteraceae bacterium]|nr:16S rRNA (uracil(1498)-N(3))-methyltransferase [Desulfobacteraceae bacterium]